MTITDVQTQVEELSQAMVLLDPADTAEMARIGEQLQDLAGNLTQNDQTQAASIAAGAASVTVDGAQQGEVPAAVIATVNQALETLQELLDQPELVSGGQQTEEPEAEPSPQRPQGLTLSPMIDEAIVVEFLGRQSDALGDMEKLILAFESEPETGALESLKRWFHTLKGEAGLLGLVDVADLCHATEDMIQAESAAACVDRLLTVKDWLQGCFDYLMEKGPCPADAAEIIAQLTAPVAVDAAPIEPAAAAAEDPAESVVGPEAIDDAPIEEAIAAIAGDEPSAEQPDSEESRAPAAVALPDYTGKNVQEGDVGLLQDFIAEAVEHLDASEAHLLTIEVDPRAIEALNAVFRAFHTIKGLAGFVELDHIQALAHLAENLLDMARKGELVLSGTPMDLVFESVDMMKRLIDGVVTALAGSGYPEKEDQLPFLLARLQAETNGMPAPREPESEPAVDCAETVAADEPASTTDGPAGAEVDDDIPADDPPVDGPATAPADDPIAQDVVGKKGFVPLANFKQPRAKACKQEPVPAPPAAPAAGVEPPAGAVDADAAGDVIAALEAAREGRGGGKSAPAAGVKVKEAMRVDAERLDRLIETIGEMVIAESMVSQSPEIRGNMSVKLARDLDHLDKISRELQEIGMSLRMVPVRPVFQKMARLVRDLAKKTGRKVEFVMAGEDTELDKNVVDKIGDPLVHMVRNAVDHGLEPTVEERRSAGKPEAGRIELRAFHKGGNICIEIQDDGRGLPRDKILAKAIERGLIREGDVLSDREIHNLIFEPGFSTAQKVTDISGRGVGMDVVRRNIEELRGTCEIHSQAGEGSTFSIKLPLTLAIIEGMVISCGPEHYIVPTLSVVRLVRPAATDIAYVFDRGEMLAFEDEHLPLFRLGRLFNVPTAKTEPLEAVVVVVEEEGRKIGLLADDLLGQQSIVIKSLGEAMQNTEGVAGGAIMSNGNVALILDVAGLIRSAHSQQPASSIPENRQAADGAAETD